MKTKYIKVPVSERLPEEFGHYVTFTKKNEQGYNYYDDSTGKFRSETIIEYWLDEVPDREDEMRETIELYKECFAEFIPIEKYDEATEFLSTGNNGLAKDLLRREK